jgi:hypothetical protein
MAHLRDIAAYLVADGSVFRVAPSKVHVNLATVARYSRRMRESRTLAFRLRMLAAISGAVAILAGGCAGNGDGLDANGRPIGSQPPPTDDFSQIQDTVFTPICTGCHAGASAPVGLRLDEGNSYALLVNVASSEVPSLLRVDPGDPENSYLVQKIEGRAAVGGRMPLGGPQLPQESIDLVKRWIATGATPQVAMLTDSQPLQVVSTIPEQGEESLSATSVLVIFNHAVDGSLATPELAMLVSSGRDGSFREGNERILQPLSVSVSLLNPTVLTLRLAQPLAPDTYVLRIRGTGPTALADVAGRVLDGDADGVAGGDHEVAFSVVDLNDGREK